MPSYRIFFLRADGRIFRRSEIAAESDGDALRQAGALAHRDGVEVWQEARMVGAIGPRDLRQVNVSQRHVQIRSNTNAPFPAPTRQRQPE